MTLNGRRCADCDEDHRRPSFISVFLSAARVPAGRDESNRGPPARVWFLRAGVEVKGSRGYVPARQFQRVLLKTFSRTLLADLPWRKKTVVLVTRPIMMFELIKVETILEAFRG
jgi:hypothetical protein